MNPDAATLWRAPMWALSVLLACLGMLGPFAIDTYLPAFTGIAASIDATPTQMQQTLSVYLVGFALMSLFHGALSDGFGRRPVVLAGVAVFTLASVGCALAQTIGQLVFFRLLQGLSTGAGIVVSRAVIRDMYPPADAQRVMSQVTLFFGVAPAVAPVVGGFLYVHAGWHAIFWFLALIGAVLWIANWRLLPETLHLSARQPLELRNLLRGYRQLGSSRRFLLLAFASGIPFNGMFLYVMAAPEFVGTHLGLGPTEFFWFFACVIGGIMAGAWWSGRLAGQLPPERQIRRGFRVMVPVSLANVVANAIWPAEAWWALPLLGLFSFGWALMVPVVTLMVLDLVPERRGMASSMQSFIASAANAFVAGLIAPLVMHSTLALALASAAMMCVGLVAWLAVKPGLRPAA
ncbi:MAG TPA: multidrug effflux MFS transporter [Methylibium sp.]|uniref:multidrug effflux MFS transporter n=1 Tax=Methylibium sp. TaxID=2067992 RepID=UPI002DBE2DA7|nr:multidrug effflux MFS transporter [Methylibium sp.]HEU4460580.1 multidrug effflux MFS transporter [Methylibium sp.]